MMFKNYLSAVVLGGLFMLAACNTVDGAGEDLQSAGQAIENAAK
jgi:predicted small secreted protein